jgi:uroporphyrinogen III methyltransferase / synthase
VSLAGKKILITRPMDQAGTITQLLREHGAEAVYFPTIRIQPTSTWEECDEAIDNLRTYRALVFTSVNAVRYFFNRAVERGLKPGLLPNCTVYTVGAKTAEGVASFGIMASRLPGVTNSRTLAEVLSAQPVLQKRFLIPKGNLAGSEIAEALRARGANVDEVIVYETVSAEGEGAGGMSAAGIREMIHQGDIDAITFFSPSSVDNFFALIPGDAVKDTIIAAIGLTTAEALDACTVRAHVVPARPSSEDLVAALEEFFLRDQRSTAGIRT